LGGRSSPPQRASAAAPPFWGRPSPAPWDFIRPVFAPQLKHPLFRLGRSRFQPTLWWPKCPRGVWVFFGSFCKARGVKPPISPPPPPPRGPPPFFLQPQPIVFFSFAAAPPPPPLGGGPPAPPPGGASPFFSKPDSALLCRKGFFEESIARLTPSPTGVVPRKGVFEEGPTGRALGLPRVKKALGKERSGKGFPRPAKN